MVQPRHEPGGIKPHCLTTIRVGLEKLLPMAEAEIMRILWARRRFPGRRRLLTEVRRWRIAVPYTPASDKLRALSFTRRVCRIRMHKGIVERKSKYP